MRSQFDITQPMTTGQGGADLEMQTPTRPAGFVSDLVVPFGQSLITGALVSGLITYALGRTDFDGDLGALFVGLALTIGTVTWVLVLADTRRLLRTIERLAGLDLDGDGVAGDPKEKRRLEVHVQDGRGHTRIVESEWLGIDDDRLIAFSVGMNNGRGLAEGTWGKERAIFPGGINSFRAFRGKLEEAGLIAMVNPKAPNLGYETTAAGRAFFRRLASMEKEYTHTHTHEA